MNEKEDNMLKTKREVDGLISILTGISIKRIKLLNLLKQSEEVKRDSARVKELSKRTGVDPEFITSLLHLIDNESLHELPTKTPPKEQPARRQFFRENLLQLTKDIASTYEERFRVYSPFAIDLYSSFEEKIIMKEVETLETMHNTGLAVDLGCAVGRITLKLSPHFEEVKGIDISPQMISTAIWQKTKGANYTLRQNVDFIQADIEEEMPIAQDSASLVVMNLGTASDIHDIRILLGRIKKMLKKDGRFVLSFYNANALYYHLSIPWCLGLTAEIDPIEHCLNVHVDKNDYLVYAKPYRVSEITKVFQKTKGLSISQTLTYPTMASILPNELLMEEGSRKTIEKIDQSLTGMNKGAYILVTGRKS